MRIPRHGSQAFIVALLAVVAVAGGTAIASSPVTTAKQKHADKGADTKLFKKLLKNRAGSLRVSHAATADRATTADHAATADAVPALQFKNVALKHGWIESPGGGAPQIAKGSDGVVHLRGLITRTSGSSNIPFTVPAGFVPTIPINLVVVLAGGATGSISIGTDGEVQVGNDVDHPGASSLVSLAGVSYTLPY